MFDIIAIQVLLTILMWEIMKWAIRSLFWKKAYATVPLGTLTITVARFGPVVGKPDFLLDNLLTSSGMHRVN